LCRFNLSTSIRRWIIRSLLHLNYESVRFSLLLSFVVNNMCY
jgi:hypothetical protein